MKNLFARAHIYAMSHAPAVVATTMVAILLGRLAFTNPAMAAVIALLILGAIAQAFAPRSMQLTASQAAAVAPMLLVGTSLLIAASPADALSIGGIAKSLKNDMGSMFDAFVYACYGGGVVSTAVGVNNGIKKSKGDQQVTTGSIFGYGLGGPALGMVGFMMDSAAESMGGGASSMNKLPGGL